jgi:DNA repair exonuclease SbcCD ATPase subunit
MNYPGFQDWYKSFNTYLQSNKDKSPMLSITSSLLNMTGSLSSAVPLTGPITTALFGSMTSYIDNMGKKQKDLKAQSEQMLALTMKLSQFNYDKDQIEHEWETITKELQDLQAKYEKSINENLKTLGVNNADFAANFTKENDAERRYLYLTELRKKAAGMVHKEKEANPKEWKQQVFIPMNEVQALKLRFGQITFRISQNIVKYNDLFAKYRNDNQLGSRIKDLEVRLKDLQETFDKAFDPLDYINSANKMYKVS